MKFHATQNVARPARPLGLLVAAGLLAAAAAAEIRVQDVAHLQGSHANRLMGFGLVVGLPGTGDGAASPATLRALMQLHKVYHAPVIDAQELKGNKSVAIVAVECVLPESGVRAGGRVDVIVSAIGAAKSLKGGQLLTTPLQEATLAIPDVLALAGGRLEIPAEDSETRAVIRKGAVIEEDLFYHFIEDGHVTLTLHDAKADYNWAHMLARSIDAELQSFARGNGQGSGPAAQRVVATESFAIATGPNAVRVRIPEYYLSDPAPFISRVLSARIFQEPAQRARVVINRTSQEISFTGNVSISPTILMIPGLGTVSVGGGAAGAGTGVQGLATHQPDEAAKVEFQTLLSQLSQLQLQPEQLIAAVEQLHRTGTLHAELVYTE